MNIHLGILALQSLRKIMTKLGVKAHVPGFFDLYGSSPAEFEDALQRVSLILHDFIREYGITWWDIYLESDIGAERVLLLDELGISGEDRVLDVGCGRGYFSYAAARVARMIVGIDLMDALGRVEWWDQFLEAVRLLKLEGRVYGVAADAAKMPFRDSWFDVAAAVHSVRNFGSIEVVKATVKEMKRVVKPGGYVILVENIPTAKSELQRNHLRLHSLRVRFIKSELSYLSKEELTEIINEMEFKDVEVKVVDYGLCSTPAIFYIGKEQAEKGGDPVVISEFREVTQAIRRVGEASPPALIIKARK